MSIDWENQEINPNYINYIPIPNLTPDGRGFELIDSRRIKFIDTILAKRILLSSVTGDLDDIADGTTWGKVALTSITAGKIIVAGLDSGVTARMFSDSTTQTNIEAWRHASDVTLIDGGDIYTGSVTTTQLNFTPVEDTNVIASINASAEGITIDADNIAISGSTTFTAGWAAASSAESDIDVLNTTNAPAVAGATDDTEANKKIDDSTYGTGGSYASAASGARVLIFPDANTGIQIIDDAANDVFKALVGGTDVGDVIIGDYAGGIGVKWDKSAGTFTVLGSIIQTASSGERIEMGTTVNNSEHHLSLYDSVGTMVLRIGHVAETTVLKIAPNSTYSSSDIGLTIDQPNAKAGLSIDQSGEGEAISIITTATGKAGINVIPSGGYYAYSVGSPGSESGYWDNNGNLLANSVITDNIYENTAGIGVTIDSVLLKDGNVEVSDTIRGATANGYINILGDSGASNGIKLYDDGVFEAPTQAGFRAYRTTSNQSISASTSTKVQFNAENYDEQAEYDNSTNYEFTAERAGKYLAIAQCYWTSSGAGDSFKTAIFLTPSGGSKNEIAMNWVDVGGSGALSQPVSSGVLELGAGDKLHVEVETDTSGGGTISTGEDKTFFSVFKVS